MARACVIGGALRSRVPALSRSADVPLHLAPLTLFRPIPDAVVSHSLAFFSFCLFIFSMVYISDPTRPIRKGTLRAKFNQTLTAIQPIHFAATPPLPLTLP